MNTKSGAATASQFAGFLARKLISMGFSTTAKMSKMEGIKDFPPRKLALHG
ncbi:MAG: hypothetical protein LUD79_00400 [Oscillospiraceae bacterium]|nr:hypothetical protein [Oscillospiraceae bacterium]